jgi:NTP pyrophosphatase (non-canonical NTP hydrolase)
MTIKEYQELAMRTVNPDLDKRDMLINSVMGLCGESGEAIDIVKKWFAHGHELDREHLKKELGDIAWYLAEAATALDISLDEVLEANIEKLKKRYPEGFATEKSINRDENDN